MASEQNQPEQAASTDAPQVTETETATGAATEASSGSPPAAAEADAPAEAVPAEAPAANAPAANAPAQAATAPDAADPQAPPATTTDAAEPAAPASEAAARPDAPPTPEPSTETTTADAKPAGSEAAPEAAADGGDGAKKKKRRRRRRKKKTGEAAGADAEGAPKEGRGARPATDRAPFHVGEEVFGKVTAILETAIMLDLSGKALAIFDRGEMEADDLMPSVGDRFTARVHNNGSRGGLVVLTRKPLREEEVKPKVEAAAKDGTLIQGLVTGAIKGGVEVDIDGLRAFAPASGMDLHPARANLTGLVGQRLDFKVIQFKSNGRDVVVSRRPMLEKEAHERRKKALETLAPDQVVKGVVRTVVEWGAFLAIPEAENLEGLVHISEASHDPRQNMSDIVKPGDEVEVKITKIDEKGKIWLSRKALIEDPWAEAKAKYTAGSQHKGKITRVESFGGFVEFDDGIDGLLHVADLSPMVRLEHANEKLKVGDEIEVRVHHFDKRTRKISLHPLPAAEHADEKRQRVAKGQPLDVEVVKPEGNNAGLLVRVLGATGRASRGFLPAGHTGAPRGADLRKRFPTGTKLKVKVIDLDPRRGEPKVSVRALKEDEERTAVRDYKKSVQSKNFGTLGDLLAKAGVKKS